VGGFFPPQVLGIIRDATGGYAIGFILLIFSAIICLGVNYFAFISKLRTVRAVSRSVCSTLEHTR